MAALPRIAIATPRQDGNDVYLIDDETGEVLVAVSLLAVEGEEDALIVDAFFSDASIDGVADAIDRFRVAEPSRTLPGAAMEWVRATAKALGAKTIELVDMWEGYNGDTSDSLQVRAYDKLEYEDSDPWLEAKERRMNTGSAEGFYERIANEGYYGMWGMARETPEDRYHTVDTDKMLVLRSSFGDLAA